MKTKLIRSLNWALALLPMVLLVVLYGQLPDQVPTHWGIDGTVTYSGKATLWMLSLLPFVLNILMGIFPGIDPRKKNYDRFRPYYEGARLALTLFFLVMIGVTLVESFWPGAVSISRVIVPAIGILFVFLGNLMPKLKSNFFMGIKSPWTLSDPDVWNRTQRLGGLLFFFFGLLLIPSGLLMPELFTFVFLIVGAVTVSLLPIVLSYFWYRKKTAEQVDKCGEQ